MVPIRLTFQGFGSYIEETTVDFTKYEQDKLFLIKGDTGSGKTLILDAMCFALYGEGCYSGRQTYKELRCRELDKKDKTIVTFEFKYDKYYLLERKYTGNATQAPVLSVKTKSSISDEWGDEKKYNTTDAKKWIDKLIGLSREQFCQVVILPQGQFSEFLVSETSKKQEILVKLFGEEKWVFIAEEMNKRAGERYDNLEKEQNEYEEERVKAGFDTTDDLLKAKEKEERLKKELEKTKNRLDKDFKAISNNLEIAKKYDDLDDAEDTISKLESEESIKEIKAKNNQYTKAKNANNVKKIIDEEKRLKKTLENLKNEYDNKDKEKEALQLKTKEIKEELKKHKKQENIIIEKKEELNRCISMESSYKEYDGLKNNLDREKDKLDKEKRKIEIADSELEEIEKGISNILEDKNRVETERDNKWKEYIKNIASEIADEIRNGHHKNSKGIDFCPVCGNEHIVIDKLAKHEEGAVTLDEIDNLDETIKSIEKSIKEKRDDKSDLEENKNKIEKEYDRLIAEYNHNNGMLQGYKDGFIENIDSLDQLQKTIKSNKDEINRYDEVKKNLEDQLRDCEKEEGVIIGIIEDITKKTEDTNKKHDTVENDLQNEIEKNGFKSLDEVNECLLEDEKYTQLIQDIQDYNTKVKETKKRIEKLKKDLKGKKRENTDQLTEDFKKNRDETETNSNSLNESSTKLEKYAELIELYETVKDHNEKIKKATEIKEKTEMIAKHPSGMSLPTYVSAINLQKVIDKTNDRMSDVDALENKYRLSRTDSKASGKGIHQNKAGLELAVQDGRLASTLSGGEKFVVSLALALSLQSVVSVGPNELQAVFIDEGFGTLDKDRLEETKALLRGKAEEGMVGIISHIEDMESLEELSLRLPTLEVFEAKDGKGSYIVQ